MRHAADGIRFHCMYISREFVFLSENFHRRTKWVQPVHRQGGLNAPCVTVVLNTVFSIASMVER